MAKALGIGTQPLPDLKVAQPLGPIEPELIKDVIRNGDAIDTMRSPLGKFAAHQAVKSTLITSAASMQFFSGALDPNPRFLMYGAGAGLSAEAGRRVQRIRQRKRTEKRLHAQEGLADYDEPIELFRHTRRKSKGKLDLYWGAELNREIDTPEDIRQRLETVAGVAEMSKIEQVIVPGGVLDFLPEGSNSQYKLMKTAEWMKGIKRLGNRVPLNRGARKEVIESDEDGEHTKKKWFTKNVLNLTPEECIELAEKIAPELFSNIDVFKFAWDSLQKDQPSNKFLHRYAKRVKDLSNPNNTAVRQQAATTLRGIIASSLSDVALVAGPDHQTVRVDMTGTISRKRPSVRMNGSHHLQYADADSIGLHAEEFGTLLAQLGIKKQEIALFYDNPGKLTQKQRIQIAQVVMLYEVSGWEQPYSPDIAQRTGKGTNVALEEAHSGFRPSLQLSVAHNQKMLRRKTRKQLDATTIENLPGLDIRAMDNRKGKRLLGALLLTGLLATQTSKIVNAPANLLYSITKPAQEESYIKKMMGDIDKACSIAEQSSGFKCDPKALMEELKKGKIPYDLEDDFNEYSGDPLNDGIAKAVEIDDKINETLLRNGISGDYLDSKEAYDRTNARRDIVSDYSDALGRADDGVSGNIDRPENRPLWLIENNGQDTTGYWSQSTFNRLLVHQDASDGFVKWVGKGVVNIDDYEYAPRPIVTKSPKEVQDDDSLVHVRSALPMSINTQFNDQGEDYVAVPTLKGTKPIAAKVSSVDMKTGEQIDLEARFVQLNDGTFSIVHKQIDDFGVPVTVEYWLQRAGPHTRSPYGDVKAKSGVSVLEFDYGDGTPAFEIGKARTEIDEHIPGLPADGPVRTERLAAVIRDGFLYSDTPFLGVNYTGDRRTSAAEYIDLALKSHEASYGTASTILALDSPDRLNVVSGYFNSVSPDDQYNTLSVNESTQWDIDTSGNIYNGTPTYTATPEAPKNGSQKGGVAQSGMSSKANTGSTPEGFDNSDFELPPAPGAEAISDETTSESSFDSSSSDSSSNGSSKSNSSSKKAPSKEKSGAESAKEQREKIIHILEALGAATLTGVAIYKRREITAKVHQTKQQARKARAYLANKRLNRILDHRTSEATTAIGIIEDSVFLQQGQPAVLRKQLEPLTATEIRDRLHRNRHPDASANKKIAVQKISAAAQTNDELREDKRTRRLAARMIKLDRIQSLPENNLSKKRTNTRNYRKAARSAEVAVIASSALFQQPTDISLGDQSPKQIIRTLKANPVMQQHNWRTRRAVRRLVRNNGKKVKR